MHDKNPKEFNKKMGFKLNLKDFDKYIASLEKHDKFKELLKYEPIIIIEKEPTT